MRGRHVTGGCVIAFALAGSGNAHAEGAGKGQKVVVLSPHPDEVSARLVRELQAVTLDASIAAGDGKCDQKEIQSLATATQSPSVVCMGETDISVWVTEGDGLRLREQIAWSAEPSSSDPAIVQTTEVVRARLAALPPPTDPKPPEARAEGVLASTIGAGPVKDEAPAGAPKPLARNTPRVIASVGFASVLSPGYQPTWGLGMEGAFGISRHASLVLNAVVPVTSAQFSDSTSSASAHTTEIGAGLQIPLLSPDSRLIPRLGGGWGIVHMHTQPVDVPDDGHSKGHEEDLISPYLYLDAALSARIYGPVRLTAAAQALGTPARFQVRLNDATQGGFGGLVMVSSLRAEVQLP